MAILWGADSAPSAHDDTHHCFNRGWRFFGGLTGNWLAAAVLEVRFNRGWRFFGGLTASVNGSGQVVGWFQSRMAILWGADSSVCSAVPAIDTVSIADGDSLGG